MALAAKAEIYLRRNLQKIAEEQNYTDPVFKITQVSTEGANFTSFLFQGTISNKEKGDLKLFAKVAAIGEKFRSQAPFKVFEVETKFYTDLGQLYRELEDNHGVPEEHRFKYPKMYAVDPTPYEETFVMEDLAAKGYQLHDRFKSVNWDHAAASFIEIAKMHALSMALKHEKPEKFKEFAEVFKFDMSFVEGSDTRMKAMMEKGMQRAVAVTRDENKGQLMAFLGQAMGGGGVETFMKFYHPGDMPVIRHGDFRPSNIMHRVDKDGSLDIVVVDFQTLLVGNPIIDLLYFIFLGTDKQFRDQHYQELIDHYYKHLETSLSRLGLDAKEVYPRKKFDEDWKENLLYGLLVSLTTLPLVTVDPTEAPSVTGEQDMEAFMQMQCSAIFVDRINGIIEDFISWGVL